MNFLAHIHLSHGLEPVMVGNLVADGYKGKKYLDLPADLQKGVLLHRKIDDLTDHSRPTLELKAILAPSLGRYGGVASDIYYDHFLARYWDRYHAQPLQDFVQGVYAGFKKYDALINVESRGFLAKMEEYNWLLSYADLSRLEVIFRQMSRRTGVEVLAGAIQPLETHYAEIEQRFFDLYPLLMAETRLFLGLD